MKPILFNTEMVQALLDGRKTQTRRVIKPQPERTYVAGHGIGRAGYTNEWVTCHQSDEFGWEAWKEKALINCPYGQPGDLLWVRETFTIYQGYSDSVPLYKTGEHDDLLKWSPSIHMPRWASRLTLKITNVRVERVQDISEEDAKAEGVYSWNGNTGDVRTGAHKIWGTKEVSALDPVAAFELLWDSINTKRGYSWESNPWVWVIEFEVIKKNIDELEAA